MPNRITSLNVHSPLIAGGRLLYALDDAWNVSIKRMAMGGPFDLNFHLRGRDSVDEWLTEGLGRHITVFNPDLEWMWSGFANLIEASVGTIHIQRGPFLNIGNKVCVEYSTIDWSSGEPNFGVRNFTDWAEDEDSQAKYGILHKVVSTAGANEDRGEQIRDTALREIKEPEMTETENPMLSSIASVTVHCLGYWHWLNTYTYESTTTGSETVTEKVENVLNAEPNGTIFDSNRYYLRENPSEVGAYAQDRRTAASIIKASVALGDSSYNRWLFWFEEDQVPNLHVAPSGAEYRRSVTDPGLDIYHYQQDYPLKPWDINAGKWMIHTDFLETMYGEAELDTWDIYADPRYFFIEESVFRPPYNVTVRGQRNTRLKQLINQFGVGGFRA